MSLLYLLDTNMVSYLITGRSAALEQSYFAAETQHRIAISTITEAEIRFGLAKRPANTKLRREYEIFFLLIERLPWDSAAAQAYGQLRADLQLAGKTLAMMDLLIASHAIAAGAVLVSHDQAFRQVDALITVDWATDLACPIHRAPTIASGR